ncbi:CDP-alcohol phosphatidyltransferase family protein [Nocardia sp. CA-129566]|uniref:CDP-alcohol phosphatidyltransferase family protein n=1 Tax=Nocardia sp. CA-129566 TaxID=3239976 RepID=UPI003D98DA2B
MPATHSENNRARRRDRVFRSGLRPGEQIEVHDRIATWANAITLVRLLFLPVIAYLVLAWDLRTVALVLLVVSAVGDCLDGYVARRFHQVSRLGEAMDPVTDRLTLVTMAGVFIVAGIVPWWLGAAIVVRDAVLTTLLATVFGRRLPIPVTRVAKMATALLLFGVPGLLLAAQSAGWWIAIVMCGAGVCLYYVSLCEYIIAWRRA